MPHRYCKFSDKLRLSAIRVAFEGIRRINGRNEFSGEYHNYWEFIYIISGKGTISSGDKLYVLSEGEIIFHKPMEFHKYSTIDGDSHIFVMSFDLEGDMQNMLWGAGFKLNDFQKQLINRLIEMMRKNINEKLDENNTEESVDFLATWQQDDLFTREIKNMTELLFIDIINHKTTIVEQYESKHAIIYNKIISIMEENIYGWISIDDIAKKCAFSAPYIKKVFTKYAGCGIHNYFVKMKIKKAIYLIEYGYSVRQVSEKLSFSTPNYFSIVFKRETGYSPLKYLNKDVTINKKYRK